MGKDQKQGKLRKFVQNCCKAIGFLLTPSLVTYFAQSGAIYVVNGLYTWLTMPAIEKILCQIPAEYNKTLGHTVGCNNCTDNLLMCGKGWCYKAAMNISMIVKDSGTHKSWKDMFLQAIVDRECNLKVSESVDPMAMMNAILSQRAATPNSPTDKCLQWHCQVMQLAALTNTDLSHPSGVCTNAKKTKPDYLAESCVCNSMALNFDSATSIAAACGPTSAALPSRVFVMAVGTKNDCFKTSIDPGAKSIMNAQYVSTTKKQELRDLASECQ